MWSRRVDITRLSNHHKNPSTNPGTVQAPDQCKPRNSATPTHMHTQKTTQTVHSSAGLSSYGPDPELVDSSVGNYSYSCCSYSVYLAADSALPLKFHSRGILTLLSSTLGCSLALVGSGMGGSKHHQSLVELHHGSSKPEQSCHERGTLPHTRQSNCPNLGPWRRGGEQTDKVSYVKAQWSSSVRQCSGQA